MFIALTLQKLVNWKCDNWLQRYPLHLHFHPPHQLCSPGGCGRQLSGITL